ncbi:MAG: zf-TFIIB domain-containing protein, partial [Planctomycetaceae bacterium]|nr:zf-TFIIB domain-containing protein [Planctomycetaceae bacterium]
TAAACTECHGVLLSNHVFGAVVQQRRAGFQGAEPPPRPVDREQLHQTVPCPGCDKSMETHIYAGPGCQVIDSCAACHLVWIDSGELTAIERAPGRR